MRNLNILLNPTLQHKAVLFPFCGTCIKHLQNKYMRNKGDNLLDTKQMQIFLAYKLPNPRFDKPYPSKKQGKRVKLIILSNQQHKPNSFIKLS